MDFSLTINDKQSGEFSSRDLAISTMESLFECYQKEFPEEKVTLSVKDSGGLVTAAISNKRIMATIFLQAWAGEGDDLINVKTPVNLDVTDEIIASHFKKLQGTVDRGYGADWLKDDRVAHEGPFDVEVEQSICEFFGADRVSEITAEALEYVKTWYAPTPYENKSLTLTLQLKVKVKPGTNLETFAKDLDFQILSNSTDVIMTNLGSHAERQAAKIKAEWK